MVVGKANLKTKIKLLNVWKNLNINLLFLYNGKKPRYQETSNIKVFNVGGYSFKEMNNITVYNTS